MANNADTQLQISALDQEREAVKSQTAEVAAKLDKEHPEANINTNWWVPAIDFGFDVKGRLPADTQGKINACCQRIIDQKYAPDAVDSALEEGRGYLVGHEDLLEQFDNIFGNRSVWDIMYKHELEKDKELASRGDSV